MLDMEDFRQENQPRLNVVSEDEDELLIDEELDYKVKDDSKL